MKNRTSPLAKALPHGASKQLAEFLGVAESTLNAWVHHRPPPKKYLVAIEWWCRVHANPVSVEELMGVEFPPGCRVRAADHTHSAATMTDAAADADRALAAAIADAEAGAANLRRARATLRGEAVAT
jgi:DNA-binding transcriptional regulator YdaS (Cro superfamily)